MKFKFLILFLINFGVLSVGLIFCPLEYKIHIKHFLFSKEIPNGYLIKLNSLESLSNYGFIQEGRVVESFKGNTKFNFRRSMHVLDSANSIISEFPYGMKSIGCGEHSDDLKKNIDWVLGKHGCCSDYTQVFIAFALANDIKVREVNNVGHTFLELYDHGVNKWIFFDPQYGLYAVDYKNQFMSAYEIFKAYESRVEFKFKYVSIYERTYKNNFLYSSHFKNLHGKRAYALLRYTNGNNIFTVNDWNIRLSFLNRSIRQFLLINLGIEPGYYVLYRNKVNHQYSSIILISFFPTMLSFNFLISELLNFILYRRFKI